MFKSNFSILYAPLMAFFLQSPDPLGAKPYQGLTLSGEAPLIIGHRGASGYRPEHTLASYQLAMELGVDFIEPDIVITKDAVLVARHEPNIMNTTNVAAHPEFKDRRKVKLVDGEAVDGYFVEDFTLAELKTLRAVQSQPFRDQSYNGLFEVPTLAEVIALVMAFEKETTRKVGLYPETKHPSYFRAQNLPLEEKLINMLVSSGFTDPKRVFIQSFEVDNLQKTLPALMKSAGVRFPLIQLFGESEQQPYDFVLQGRTETYGDLMRPESLKNIVACYAAGIGPWKASFILRAPSEPSDINGDGKKEAQEKLTGKILPLVADAHRAGLLVHPYTMRNEEQFLAVGYTNPFDEYIALMKLGVDGTFTDFPDTAIQAKQLFSAMP